MNVVYNQDCTRRLLQYLASELHPDSTGKKKRPVKLRKSISELSEYSEEDIYRSASYLADKGFICLVDKRSAPRSFVITGVSSEALDYLQAVEDNNTWKKLKSVFSDVFKASLSEILSAAASDGIHHLFGK